MFGVCFELLLKKGFTVLLFGGAFKCWFVICDCNTVKPPVLSGHSKNDKTKVLMTNGSLMKH